MGEFGTAAQYQAAINRVLQKGLSPRHRQLLREHLRAPNHAASAAELAKKVGYRSWRDVNLQYGKFAHRVATEMGAPRPRQDFWPYILVRWASTRAPNGDIRFTLRPEVVKALTRLGV